MARKKSQKLLALKLFVLVLAAFWAALYFSGSGILIGSTDKRGDLLKGKECTYFTGVGTVTRELRTLDIEIMQDPVCPRLVDLT